MTMRSSGFTSPSVLSRNEPAAAGETAAVTAANATMRVKRPIVACMKSPSPLPGRNANSPFARGSRAAKNEKPAPDFSGTGSRLQVMRPYGEGLATSRMPQDIAWTLEADLADEGAVIGVHFHEHDAAPAVVRPHDVAAVIEVRVADEAGIAAVAKVEEHAVVRDVAAEAEPPVAILVTVMIVMLRPAAIRTAVMVAVAGRSDAG